MTNRICIIPDLPNLYDIKMVSDLSSGLRQIGYDAHYSASSVENKDLNSFVEKNGFNTILRINRLPPEETKRSNDFRHISWFQDVFPSMQVNDAIFKQDDLVCTLGSKDTLGLKINDIRYAGSFNLYINPEDFRRVRPKYGNQEYDANLVGFIPLIPWVSELEHVKGQTRISGALIFHNIQIHMKRLAETLRQEGFEKLSFKNLTIKNILRKLHFYSDPSIIKISQKIEREYDILCGSLDIQVLLHSIERKFGKDFIEKNADDIDFCVRELPRFLDRYVLAEMVSKVTQNFVICGNNWEFLDNFKPFLNGPVSMEKSLNIFSNSKLTLQNNNHGIGIHSRTLSAMAMGGFVFTHTSPRDELPGGIKSIFEPDVHYGSFDADSIVEETKRWLSSDKERDEIAERARRFVLSEMHWGNGAIELAKMIDLQL